MEQYRETNEAGTAAVSAELLSLIHYFDVERLWQQCIAVIKADGATPCDAWFWLSFDLSRFGLKAEEDWLIQQAAKDVDVDDSESYREHISDLPHYVVPRVLQALHQRIKELTDSAANED